MGDRGSGFVGVGVTGAGGGLPGKAFVVAVVVTTVVFVVVDMVVVVVVGSDVIGDETGMVTGV
jgi:hypothetical protein